MSVERIARSLREIDKGTEHRAMCPGCADCEPRTAGGIAFCDCGRADRAAARQAAAVLEALEAAHADGAADDWGCSIGLWETVLPIFERLAGSPRDKEETPNA